MSTCKACGVKLEFKKSAQTGKILPLQRVMNVYFLEGGQARAGSREVAWYVSHYETCSDPGRFGKR